MVVRLLTEKATKHLLIVLFIMTGIALMGARWLYFDADRILSEDTAWKISLQAHIEVSKDITIIHGAKPKIGAFHRLISQRFYHPGLKVVTSTPKATGFTRIKATASGITELLIEYQIQVSSTPKPQLYNKPALSPEKREHYLQTSESIDITLPSLVTLSDNLRRDVTDKSQLIQKFFQHSKKLVKGKRHRFDELKHIIPANKATTIGRARLMVALCRENSIPARIVTGFLLEENTSNTPYYRVEIYDEDKQWLAFDPEKGYEVTLPNTHVAFNNDTQSIFSIENGKLINVKFSISEDLDILSVARFEQEKNFFDIFDLRRLDMETRQTLIKILILPFCVLLTAFFRHVLGFYPYGVFTASLLALAMVYAEPLITLIIAGIVITLTLLGRSILPKSLSRSPRLSLIFTFVAISMVLSVSILEYISINPGGNIILIPTIILASIVDRFYSYMDESGAHAALLRLGVTVLIAIFCIPILMYEDLGILVLTYPELHLLTLALVLLLSKYQWKRVTDYKYLKLLGENKPRK